MNKAVPQKPLMEAHCGECAHHMHYVTKNIVRCENKHCPQKDVQFDVSMFAQVRESARA